MLKFRLPDIGEGVVEAEVLEWKVRVGDLVTENQPLVELLTDKVSLEIPAPTSGRLAAIHFQPGDIAPVGAVLLEIEESSAPLDSEAIAPPPASPPKETEPPPPPPAAPRAQPTASHPPPMPPRPQSNQLATQRAEPGVRATPAVRALAKRLGIDLSSIPGTGPGGRILRADIEAFAAGSPSTLPSTHAPAMPLRPSTTSEAPRDPEDWQRHPFLGLRRVIAQRMRESVQRAAHFSYVDEIDLSELSTANDGLGEAKLSPLAYIARAVVRTLPDFPMLNASIDEERNEIIEKRAIHLGIATAVGDNLLVPVVHNAQTYGVRELAEQIERLAQAARTGNLQREELSGGTFTISSLGKLGGLVATPIINPPESAILAVNKLRLVPRYVSGELIARTTVNLSISVDHRIADGLLAARFIEALKAILDTAHFPDIFQEGCS